MTNIKCLLNSSVFICMFFHLTELELCRSELRGRCVSLQTTPSFTHSSQSLVHTYHSLLREASSRVSTLCSRFYSVLLSGGEICASDRVLTESADITSVRISLLPLFCAGCHFYWKFCQKTETDSVQAYHVTGKKQLQWQTCAPRSSSGDSTAPHLKLYLHLQQKADIPSYMYRHLWLRRGRRRGNRNTTCRELCNADAASVKKKKKSAAFSSQTVMLA